MKVRDGVPRSGRQSDPARLHLIARSDQLRIAADHDHARQSIESLHSGFKDDGKEGVESSGRRRVRGFAAGQILVTIMILNFNLRTIAKFLRDEVEANAEPDRTRAEAIVRRRDRVWDNPYTKTTARESILDIQDRGELESPLRT